MLQVTMDPTTVSASTLASSSVTQMSMLRAGMQVSVKVESVDDGGMRVKFCDVYHGSITWHHAGV